MKFLRRHWHDLGLISAAVAVLYLASNWSAISVLQRLLILNFIVVLLHQFEEYSWPGGFPPVMNMGVMRSERPDRYPLNQNSSMVANLLFAYVFFLIPVFFPNVIWLGLAPVLGGSVLQFLSHGLLTNIRLKSVYNPGLAATVFGHIPIAVIYISYIVTNGLASTADWLLAVVWLAAYMFLGFYLIEQRLLGDKNSPYPFDPDEMKRFNVERRLARARQ